MLKVIQRSLLMELKDVKRSWSEGIPVFDPNLHLYATNFAVVISSLLA